MTDKHDQAAREIAVRLAEQCVERPYNRGTVERAADIIAAALAAKDAELAEAWQALDEAEFWLDGALNCKEWRWDADQHEAATNSLANIRSARRAREGAKQ